MPATETVDVNVLRCDGRFPARYRTVCARCDRTISRGLHIYGWTSQSGRLYTHVNCIDAHPHRGDLHCASCWHPMSRTRASWDHVKRKRIQGELRCPRRCSTTPA